MCTFQKSIQTRQPADDPSAGCFSCLNHRQIAVHAQDVHLFGGSHTVATTGAAIFAGVARLWRRCGSGGVPVPRASWCVTPFDSVHVNIRPALLNDEVAEGVGRLCDAPPDARVVADRQVTGSSYIPKFFIVIASVSGCNPALRFADSRGVPSHAEVSPSCFR